MSNIVQVTKLDGRTKYVTLWPLGRVELGARAYFHMEEVDNAESR